VCAALEILLKCTLGPGGHTYQVIKHAVICTTVCALIYSNSFEPFPTLLHFYVALEKLTQCVSHYNKHSSKVSSSTETCATACNTNYKNVKQFKDDLITLKWLIGLPNVGRRPPVVLGYVFTQIFSDLYLFYSLRYKAY
jgi:hypothetical protein